MKTGIIQITVISNILLEPHFRSCMQETFEQAGYKIDIKCLPYSENVAEYIGETDLILVCLNWEEIYPDANDMLVTKRMSEKTLHDVIMQKCNQLYDSLAKLRGNFRVIWFGFEDYYDNSDYVFGTLMPLEGIVDEINLTLKKMMNEEDVLIDLKRLIAKVGVENSYTCSGKYRWNAPYSRELIHTFSDEVLKQYLCFSGQTKKCIVLDCDNVLWGGIISEDGIEGIRVDRGLGKSFQDFQRYLLKLYHCGVILAVCSKNDEADILRVFREHSGMILKEEHIACFMSNWNSKTENMKEISKVLNIGTDSMVFVDDSDFEVHMMQEMMPEVTSVLYNRKTIYRQLSCFCLNSKYNYEQVKKRNITYRTNCQREYLRINAVSYQEYLKALKMEIDIHPLQPDEIARVSELTQRANRCSNGVRYSVEQIKRKMTQPQYQMYAVTVKDRFSDLGLVGAIGIYQKNLDVFVLSCRALGRGVEEEMLKVINGKQVRTHLFVSTGKNAELSKLLKKYSLEQ